MDSAQDVIDVFVNYAQDDDDPTAGGWVSQFHAALVGELSDRLGRAPNLYMGGRASPQVDEAVASILARTRVFVAILSPAYLSMTDGPPELDRFLELASSQPGGAGGRVFTVWKAPTSPEIVPESLRQVPEHRFYQDEPGDSYRTLWPEAEDEKEQMTYAGLIERLANQIADKLSELGEMAAPDETLSGTEFSSDHATGAQTTPASEYPGAGPAGQVKGSESEATDPAIETGDQTTGAARAPRSGTGATRATGASTSAATGRAGPRGAGTTTEPVTPTLTERIAELAEVKRGFTVDGQQLLAAAASLLPQKKAARTVLSSTTLFLAAVEWGLAPSGTPPPPEAVVNLAASLDGARIDNLRTEFFSSSPPDLSIDPRQPAPEDLAVTENVSAALREHVGSGDRPIDAAGILRALLRQSELAFNTQGRLRERLDKLGVTAAELRSLLEHGMSTHISRDLWTVDDSLGYAQYARAISNFLNDRRTMPPLTISIQAPWGGGKTSLMRMTQRELDPFGFRISTHASEAVPIGPGAQIGEVLDLLRELASSTGETTLQRVRTWLRGLASSIRRKIPWRGPISGTGGAADAERRTDPLKLSGAQCASVWFNAWRYQSSDQIWAGLAEAIVRGLTDRMDPPEREKFLLRLHLSRVNAEKIRNRIYEAVLNRFLDVMRKVGVWALGGLVALAIAVWQLAFPPGEGGAVVGVSTLVLGVLGSAGAYIKALFDAESEPAKLNLAEYVDVPDYSENLGFIHHVTQDLERVFALLPEIEVEGGGTRRVPLAIFIDDLDRCAPPKIAEVFEALNLFIAGEFQDCYIVIGMDTEVVAAALEEAHKDVIERLPGDARRAPVGRRFMDKFVQLPFVIPPLDDKAVADYAESLAAAGDKELRKLGKRLDPALERQIEEGLDRGEAEDEIVSAAAHSVAPVDAPLPEAARAEGQRLARQFFETIRSRRDLDKQARDFERDNARIRDLLHRAKNDFSHNPRELKRLINLYRFYYNLRLARVTRQQRVPTEAQLKNWLMFSLAWPEAARWSQRSHSEWEAGSTADVWSTNGAGNRLARMESLAVAMVTEPDPADPAAKIEREPTGNDWSAALRAEYELPDAVKWPDDVRLFAFFRRIALQHPSEHLSAGAGLGFW